MDTELISLLYDAEENGIYDLDVSELEIYVGQHLLTSISRGNTTSNVPNYIFWFDNGNTEEAIDIPDEEKIVALKEIMAWC